MHKDFKCYEKDLDGNFRSNGIIYTADGHNHKEILDYIDNFMRYKYQADYRTDFVDGFVYRWEDETYLVELLN